MSSNGELIITLTDNSVLNLGNVKGEKGDKGEDGRGITKTELVNGELVIFYTDGTTDNLGDVNTNVATEDANGLIYELLSDGTYGVRVGTAYQNSSITIPSTYNEKAVTVILEHGFDGCSNLEAISIPNSITSIRDYAFNSCKQLINVILPNNLISIGRFAFYECSLLKTISIPSNVNFIGAYAFFKTSLTSATFENPNGWSAGVDGITYNTLNRNSNTGGVNNYSNREYKLSDSAKASEALTLPVEVAIETNTSSWQYQNKYWYSEDWSRN